MVYRKSDECFYCRTMDGEWVGLFDWYDAEDLEEIK